MKAIDFILNNLQKVDELVKVIKAALIGLDAFVNELKGVKENERNN